MAFPVLSNRTTIVAFLPQWQMVRISRTSSASAKSAFIPKTRVQVYFLESEKYFQSLTNLLYKSKNGRILMDNAERYEYYSKSVLSTLHHRFCVTDIFVCNGWQYALIPIFYINESVGIKEFSTNHKTVLDIPDLDQYTHA